MCGLCKAVGYTTSTGHEIIDGLLSGAKWQGPVSYSFPQVASAYAYKGEVDTEFYTASRLQKDAASFAIDKDFGASANDGFSIEGFTAVEVTLTTANDANIRVAQSALPPTAWAYLPGTDTEAGDVWLGAYAQINYPKAGDYGWHTVLHEMGHSMGLKHGHEALNGFDALPTEYDSLETTIMTYRSYEGSGTTGYSYENWGAPQTFMMADIAALQEMYGADFDTNSSDTVYSWTQGEGSTYVDGAKAIYAGGDVIFATIWDGGGNDTYDLSKFKSRLEIDLAPGSSSTFATAQLSNLGQGHTASGNIYNALQYQDDDRSLIENAIGGKNSDRINGNIADNGLTGGAGNDVLLGLDGNDALTGGRGNDNLQGGSGDDILLGGRGADTFVFNASDAGQDTILDFKGAEDSIRILPGSSDLDVQTLLDRAVQLDSDVLIVIDELHTIRLADFQLEHLRGEMLDI